MQREFVVLVNEMDEPLGEMEKLQAHNLGVLHRAFSVFIFNEKGEMLLQQRAVSKYHSGGLWTNACCGHPRPGEETKIAAARRLMEEMGIASEMHFKNKFIYKTKFDNSLTEHELDHIFIGKFSGTMMLNPEEVQDYKWISTPELLIWMKQQPQSFTFWFRLILDKFLS